jgi:hypothetical protein
MITSPLPCTFEQLMFVTCCAAVDICATKSFIVELIGDLPYCHAESRLTLLGDGVGDSKRDALAFVALVLVRIVGGACLDESTYYYSD